MTAAGIQAESSQQSAYNSFLAFQFRIRNWQQAYFGLLVTGFFTFSFCFVGTVSETDEYRQDYYDHF